MSEQQSGDLVAQFGRALDEFDVRVLLVGPDQWSAPTPCTEWDVRALVAHVVAEQLWAPSMLAGMTMAEVGDRFDGDNLTAEPAAAWRSAATRSRAAAAAPGVLDGTVSASYGETPGRRYLAEMTLDAAIHAWDLARAIGADEGMDPELVALGLAFVESNAELLASTGMFQPPVPVATDAPPQLRLLGLLGRRA